MAAEETDQKIFNIFIRIRRTSNKHAKKEKNRIASMLCSRIYNKTTSIRDIKRLETIFWTVSEHNENTNIFEVACFCRATDVWNGT